MVCLTFLPPSGRTGGYARHTLFHAVKIPLVGCKKAISFLYALWTYKICVCCHGTLEMWSREETRGQVLCSAAGALRKRSRSQSVPVGLGARGQSLALSVFSSTGIAGDWAQRLSVQKSVRWSYNKFIELQQNRWVHWPHSSDHFHCFMARKLPVSMLDLFIVSLYIIVYASVVLLAFLTPCHQCFFFLSPSPCALSDNSNLLNFYFFLRLNKSHHS